MKSCLIILGVITSILVFASMLGYLEEVFNVLAVVFTILFFIGAWMNSKDHHGPPGGRPGDQY